VLHDRPEIDDQGLLRYRGQWLALSPKLELALRYMVEHEGQLVSRSDLNAILWPDAADTKQLDVLMLRLRKRLTPIGLTIHTIRSRGFLLEPTGRDNEGMTWLTS
jgi:DNA-binding response OmpR family regulator